MSPNIQASIHTCFAGANLFHQAAQRTKRQATAPLAPEPRDRRKAAWLKNPNLSLPVPHKSNCGNYFSVPLQKMDPKWSNQGEGETSSPFGTVRHHQQFQPINPTEKLLNASSSHGPRWKKSCSWAETCTICKLQSSILSQKQRKLYENAWTFCWKMHPKCWS